MDRHLLDAPVIASTVASPKGTPALRFADPRSTFRRALLGSHARHRTSDALLRRSCRYPRPGERQLHAQMCADCRIHHFNASSVRGYVFLNHRKTDPCSPNRPCAGPAALKEWFEYAFALFDRNAGPFIDDIKSDLSAVAGRAYPYRRAVWGILDRIRQ